MNNLKVTDEIIKKKKNIIQFCSGLRILLGCRFISYTIWLLSAAKGNKGESSIWYKKKYYNEPDNTLLPIPKVTVHQWAYDESMIIMCIVI